MKINLELENAIAQIKTTKAKSVLIQLPDGLKPMAKEIVDRIEAETSAKAYIYFSTCYGACDVPQNFKTDLLIQWGHSEWH
jgi:diphthamide biosynthesis enzyme Dph1/Dph2-like protein